MSRSGSPVLSADASQALYDKIAEYDALIAECKAEVEVANAVIASNVTRANQLHEERNKLASGLSSFADVSWTPTAIGGVMRNGVAPSFGRFTTPRPFPHHFAPATYPSPFPPTPGGTFDDPR